MKVLITGAAGFIGSHLVQHHLNQGDEVYGVDNFTGGTETNLIPFKNHTHFHFNYADLANWDDLTKTLKKVDVVYHLAALVGMFHVLDAPLETLEININTTNVLLESLRSLDNPPPLLLSSSSELYGNQAGKMAEHSPLIIESSCKSHASYCISKMNNEATAMAYHQKYQLPVIITRLFNTIGIGQSSTYGMVVPRFIRQALAHEPITVFGSGEQSRSFCDVRDTVCLLNLLITHPKAIGQVINVGHDQKITINALAHRIKKLTHSQSSIAHQPFHQVYSEGYMQILNREPELSYLLQLTDYQYQYHLDQTLSDIIYATKKGLL